MTESISNLKDGNPPQWTSNQAFIQVGPPGPPPTKKELPIVGACPQCGCPIYGLKTVWASKRENYTHVSADDKYFVTRTCKCEPPKPEPPRVNVQSESGLGAAIAFFTLVAAVLGGIALHHWW